MISMAVACSLLIGFSVVDTSSLVLPVSGTGGTRTLTRNPTPRLLYSQCAWHDFALSLGVGAVDVGVSWVGVIGSPRADLEKEEAASIV